MSRVISSNLGNLILEYRQQHDLTQVQLVEKIYEESKVLYHDSVISRIENNRMPQIPNDTVVNIATVVDTINYGNLIIVGEDK